MSEPMIHPIERIRDAFARAHAICVGSRAHYMSIPPDLERDADLILTDAIEELAALRARVAELEREVERVTSELRGWHSLECPCCGEEGAFATEFYEGGPIACGCTGTRVCADGDTAWIDVDSGSTCAKCAALAPRAEVKP